MYRIKYSNNKRWIQIHGVTKDDTGIHTLLSTHGWRFEPKGRHWWSRNTPPNVALATKLVDEANESAGQETSQPNEAPQATSEVEALKEQIRLLTAKLDMLADDAKPELPL